MWSNYYHITAYVNLIIMSDLIVWFIFWFYIFLSISLNVMMDTCQAQCSCYSGLSLPCPSCQGIIFLNKSEIFVQLFRAGDHLWSGRSSHGFRLGARDHRPYNGDQQQATEETSRAHLRLHFERPEVAVSVVLQRHNGVHVHETQVAKETWL